jgi:transcriptional regulator with XRE-family HTH domain
MMIDGKRLRESRETRNYTREEFAEKIDVGVSQVTRYEREENDVTADVLARIARVLNVSSDYLIGLTDTPRHPYNQLEPDEAALINALRRGDYREAIKIIAAE